MVTDHFKIIISDKASFFLVLSQFHLFKSLALFLFSLRIKIILDVSFIDLPCLMLTTNFTINDVNPRDFCDNRLEHIIKPGL